MARNAYRPAFIATVGLVGSLALAGAASADELGCRLEDSTSGPPRQILRCASGPKIEAEASADVHVVDRSGQGKPDGARIGGGAALIEVPEHYPGGFQISTPRAVASVRGTIWVVDVEPQRTSVFVARGQVVVTRPEGAGTVTLNKGDGVEVGDGNAPLRVERWSRPRVRALMARFGR